MKLTLEEVSKITELKVRPRCGFCSDSSSNGLIIKEDLSAYSYKRWCFGRIVDKYYLFNSTKYSSTTCNHQRYLLNSVGFLSFLKQNNLELLIVSTMNSSLHLGDGSELSQFYNSVIQCVGFNNKQTSFRRKPTDKVVEHGNNVISKIKVLANLTDENIKTLIENGENIATQDRKSKLDSAKRNRDSKVYVHYFTGKRKSLKEGYTVPKLSITFYFQNVDSLEKYNLFLTASANGKIDRYTNMFCHYNGRYYHHKGFNNLTVWQTKILDMTIDAVQSGEISAPQFEYFWKKYTIKTSLRQAIENNAEESLEA